MLLYFIYREKGGERTCTREIFNGGRFRRGSGGEVGGRSPVVRQGLPMSSEEKKRGGGDDTMEKLTWDASFLSSGGRGRKKRKVIEIVSQRGDSVRPKKD